MTSDRPSTPSGTTATRTDPSGAVVLARAVRAEWLRLRTLRSTWALVAVATLGVLGMSLLIGLDGRGEGQTEPGETAWVAVQVLGMLLMLLLLALAALGTTGDYATGGIVPALQWTPRRAVLLAARVLVTTATVVLLGVAVALLGGVVISLLAPVGLPLDEGVDTLGAFAAVYALGAVIAVGLGLALRSTAGTVVTVLALVLVLPLVLGNLPLGWAQDVAALLPGAGAVRLVTGGGPADMSATRAVATLAAWALGALVAGGWRLLETDAT